MKFLSRLITKYDIQSTNITRNSFIYQEYKTFQNINGIKRTLNFINKKITFLILKSYRNDMLFLMGNPLYFPLNEYFVIYAALSKPDIYS